MSNVSSILTSLKNQVASTLGASWSELNYVYELSQNEFRGSDKRYGIGAESGTSVDGTNKAITIDMGFFVVLTRTFANRSSDSNERTVLSDIYDQFELININVFQKKLSNASVLLVSELSYDSPEKVDDGTISVRVSFIVKFRNQTA
jgi:hypothetical protein